MPYIEAKDREEFKDVLDELWSIINQRGISNGEMNYVMSMLAKFYIDKHGLSYNTGSDVIKAFECAKLEFYRRVVAPYENDKCETNGDVF